MPHPPRHVPASLARAVLGVPHVVLADRGAAAERLLPALPQPGLTDVGTNPNGIRFDHTVACYTQKTDNYGCDLKYTTAPINSVR